MADRNATPESGVAWKEINADDLVASVGRDLIPAVWFRGLLLGVIGGEFDPDHRARQIKRFGRTVLISSVGDNGSVKHYDLESFAQAPPRHIS
ncbi:MAG: hypothetical protein GY899_08770 [Verrucomicrobiaceae bacterium]|nr:hypothetical protein [Verrucomicrobiaceae bacterium]